MHLMVYAPHGRVGVYMLQEFCRRVGIAANDEGIQELIAALGALPPAHPLATLLRQAPDFRQASALADALLHPQDRAYSVPQLFDLLAGRAAVRPLGLAGALRSALRRRRAHPARRAPRGASRARAVRRRRALSRHDASPQRGRVPRRRRGPRAAAPSPATPGKATCRSACRTRSASRSNLPRGAAAVLINRNHTYRDIYLPIDARRSGSRRDRRHAHDRRHRAARASNPRTRACCSSGSTVTIRSPSTRRPLERQAPFCYLAASPSGGGS